MLTPVPALWLFVRSLTGRYAKADDLARDTRSFASLWTPLIPATMPAERVATFGPDSPMARQAQPVELASGWVSG